MNKYRKILVYSVLININLVYAGVSLCTKYASQQEFLSLGYLYGFGGAVMVMGLYAVLWQQVLMHTQLSIAYMFKGTSLVFVMLLAVMFFDESITWTNILGAVIIIGGIFLYAKG